MRSEIVNALLLEEDASPTTRMYVGYNGRPQLIDTNIKRG